MAAWTPPKFTYFKTPDGTLLAIDDNGDPLDCQPTLTTRVVEGSVNAEEVVDPWGYVVDEYQIPPYTVHVTEDKNPPYAMIGVAVDADGDPVSLLPEMKVTTNYASPPYRADVVLADGTKATLPTYEGTDEYSVHVAWSGPGWEHGNLEFELVAVDASGMPLKVQPDLNWDGTESGDITGTWGTGSVSVPKMYEFPPFSVHFEYPDAVYRGAATGAPFPVAIGADGKPLAIQPTFETDPLEPTNVVTILPSGDRYDPPDYEFPPFAVHLEYPEGSARGAAAPTPVPIAVDEEGVPLAVQPRLAVDPTDHTKVTATFSDLTTAPVEVHQMPKDFFVFVEASGPSSEHGSVSFVAVAVDASGTPLPIQPHFEDLDPADLTKVKAVFPDGSVYEPLPLYPPSGTSLDQWPPEQWPPIEGELTEEVPSEETGAESAEVADAEQTGDEASTADATDTTEEEIPVATGGTDDSDGATAADSSVQDGENDSTSVADDAVSVDMEEELLTAGLVDDVSRGEESVTRITLPDVAVPVGGDELPVTPITLPDVAVPVAGEELPVTPITLPDVAVPVGGEEVSVPPIPFAEPPPMGDVGAGEADVVGTTDDTIALDRTDNDLPVDVGDEGTPEADAIEFHVEAIEEVQVEEVRVEDAASVAIEEPESIAEYEDAPPEEEGFDDLDG